MDVRHSHELEAWFLDFAKSFAGPAGTLDSCLQLKVDHSARVARESRALAQGMAWPASAANLAEALGWLHDIGRFVQFARFATFDDARSADHGTLGVEALETERLDRFFNKEAYCIACAAIRHHNARAMPRSVKPAALPFLKLLRDADKLDILQLVQHRIEKDGFGELPRMLPGINLKGPVNPAVVEEIMTHRTASLAHVRSVSDFLLLQLSWVYDINYGVSFGRFLEQNTFARIVDKLPHSSEITATVDTLHRFATARADPARAPAERVVGDEGLEPPTFSV